MKLLVQSAMIFFATLMAAGLVALGEPERSDRSAAQEPTAIQALNQLLEAARPLMIERAPTSADLGR
jgi:hypothetical protein